MILEHLYHPDRLNYPLKRIGGKGEGKWQQITWHQALDEIAEKLTAIKDKAGAENVLFAEGCRITENSPTAFSFEEPKLGDPTKNATRIKEAVKVAKDADVIILALG